MTLVQKEIKAVYLGDTQVRPVIPPYLCFTANTAGSTVKLAKNGSPTAVTLETSTDGQTWSDYTIDTVITLTNIGDKVYWRNKSETDTGFSTGTSAYYYFGMTGSIAGSGDINYLLNKNSTYTASNYCYYNLFSGDSSVNSWVMTTPPKLTATTVGDYSYGQMFMNCTSLTKAPKIEATTLGNYCGYRMFRGCTVLEDLPSLSAITLTSNCYREMFNGCSKIKLSESQTGEYQTEYRIPKSGTGTTASNALNNMFYGTGGTWSGAPSINTTYYTSNTVV